MNKQDEAITCRDRILSAITRVLIWKALRKEIPEVPEPDMGAAAKEIAEGLAAFSRRLEEVGTGGQVFFSPEDGPERLIPLEAVDLPTIDPLRPMANMQTTPVGGTITATFEATPEMMASLREPSVLDRAAAAACRVLRGEDDAGPIDTTPMTAKEASLAAVYGLSPLTTEIDTGFERANILLSGYEIEPPVCDRDEWVTSIASDALYEWRDRDIPTEHVPLIALRALAEDVLRRCDEILNPE